MCSKEKTETQAASNKYAINNMTFLSVVLRANYLVLIIKLHLSGNTSSLLRYTLTHFINNPVPVVSVTTTRMYMHMSKQGHKHTHTHTYIQVC